MYYSGNYQISGRNGGDTMADRAKLFFTGRSQAVRLPREYRFEGDEVYIRRDPVTGDVVLSRRPDSWEGFLELARSTTVPADFMNASYRDQGAAERDPFDGQAGFGPPARRGA
jgi:antitoxin VapB